MKFKYQGGPDGLALQAACLTGDNQSALGIVRPGGKNNDHFDYAQKEKKRARYHQSATAHSDGVVGRVREVMLKAIKGAGKLRSHICGRNLRFRDSSLS